MSAGSTKWKLFFFVLRMLLVRNGRGGSIPKNQFQERFGRFTRGVGR